jgi:hypothetical protein
MKTGLLKGLAGNRKFLIYVILKASVELLM